MTKMFGTNGVRGIVNKDMNVQLALQMGKAIGSVFTGAIAIANDTRLSSDMISSAVCSGLMAVGCDVHDIGMVPTPALQYYVKTHDDVVAGVMITASHNPPEFNGIKVIEGDGTEASKEKEGEVEEKYDEKIPTVAWDKVGNIHKVPGAGEAYVDAIVSKLDIPMIRKAKFKVVVDCANGAACFTTPLLLKKLGVRCITLNGTPQGEFPGHPSEPTEENLGDLKKLVKDTKANLGIAHDGDADRCVFVDNKGNYVPGDITLALLARSIVMANRGGYIVTPVATSSLIDELVESAGGEVVRTAVGAPIVSRKMMEIGGKFGGEENGGLIFPDHQHCRDGAMAIGRMLENICRNGALFKQISTIPVFYTEKRKLTCPNELKESAMQFLDQNTEGVSKNKTDGLKIMFDDGWVLARPSGTEPIFRVYAESKDRDRAVELADQYETMVRNFISSA